MQDNTTTSHTVFCGPRKRSIFRTCCICGQSFRAFLREVEKGRAKYCSSRCASDAMKTPLVTKQCIYCDLTFLVKAYEADARKYCSRNCSARGQKQRPTRQCPTCGRKFEPTVQQVRQNDGIYCSRSCFHVGRRAKGQHRICIVCGVNFIVAPSRGKARPGKYCSRQCLARGWDVFHRTFRICEVCGREFHWTISDAKKGAARFCSQSCFLSSHLRTQLELAVRSALKELGEVFEEQRRFQRWTVDFYLPERHLVLEADGAYWHSTATVQARDARKDAWLRNAGYKVVRVGEFAVRQDGVDAVKIAIEMADAV